MTPAQFFSYACRILQHFRKADIQKSLQKAPKKLKSKPSAPVDGNATRVLSSFIRVDDISGRYRPEILENPSRFYAFPGN